MLRVALEREWPQSAAGVCSLVKELSFCGELLLFKSPSLFPDVSLFILRDQLDFSSVMFVLSCVLIRL